MQQLQSDGYNVQVQIADGPRDVPLSECNVTDVNGIPRGAPIGGGPTNQFTTVYVDAFCPPDIGD